MSNNIINVIRSGSIGGVSGLKGSSFAGAIGGGILMTLTGIASVSEQVGPSFIIYSLLIGLTTGMMTGALIGYFVGWLNGLASNNGDKELNLKRVNAIWYTTIIVVWIVVGYFLFQQMPVIGAVGGLFAGALAGRISIADFVKMIEVQSMEVNPDDLRPNKNRWKHVDSES